VTGPESSGTRFLSRILGTHSRIELLSAHQHTMETDEFWKKPCWETLEPLFREREIVLTRRSLPHNHRWPNFWDTLRICDENGIRLYFLLTIRDRSCMLRSQLKMGHITSISEGEANLRKAASVMEELFRTPLWFLVSYEALMILRWKLIRQIYKFLHLPYEESTEVEFLNGNSKYLLQID